jgi:hypothetical protein
VRELSWDRAAQQIEAIYDGVLERRTTNDQRPTTNDQRSAVRAAVRRAGEDREEAVERGA